MEQVKKRLGIMGDTESLGLSPNSIITQIAFVAFDLDDPERIIKTIDEAMPVEPQKLLGRDWSFETILWWMEQPETVRAKLKESNSPDPEELFALVRSIARKIGELIDESDEFEIWFRRPQHDVPMLATLFAQAGVQLPWPYDAVHDLATLMRIAGVSSKDVPNDGHITHTAVGDCRFQIRGYDHARRTLFAGR